MRAFMKARLLLRQGDLPQALVRETFAALSGHMFIE
jgi:hypothetical protein